MGKRTSRVVRSLRNGQITIPIEFRRQLGIEPDTLLELTLERGGLRIDPVRTTSQTPRSAWLRELYDQFAPVREEAQAYDEEEINAAIDEAVSAIRSKHA